MSHDHPGHQELNVGDPDKADLEQAAPAAEIEQIIKGTGAFVTASGEVESNGEFICPWCGFVDDEYTDLIKTSRRRAIQFCGSCDKPIQIDWDFSVEFTTKRTNEEP